MRKFTSKKYEWGEPDYTAVMYVEQRHIDAGERGNWDKCPIELAMREFDALHGIPHGGGLRAAFGWNSPDASRVERWMRDFDAGRPVEPLTITFGIIKGSAAIISGTSLTYEAVLYATVSYTTSAYFTVIST